MKRETFYKQLVFAGIALWIVETWYFGWNATPQSAAEQGLDLLSWLLIGWGIIGDFQQNLRIVKHYHNIYNCKKFNYIDQRVKGKTEIRGRE